MPLLDILGVDGLDQGFTVGVVFMNGESEEDYTWAVKILRNQFDNGVWPSVIATDCDEALISALRANFPMIRTKLVLCFWHVSMNVVSNCKKYFETEEVWEDFIKGFRDVVFAKTEEEFEDILEEWKESFHWNNGERWQVTANATPADVQEVLEKEMSQSALTYCCGRWLGRYKEQVAHCYVDQFFHGGTTTTSRLEGAHSVLKQWIGKPTKDLSSTWDAVKLATNHQLDTIRQHRAYCWASNPTRLRGEFFVHLRQKITPYAQFRLYDQLKIYEAEARKDNSSQPRSDPPSICTRTYWRSMGVPCWHMIKECIDGGGMIQPLYFHPHWHWRRPRIAAEFVELPTPILDPVTRQQRRIQEAEKRASARQHARARVAASGRILSQHEQIQDQLRHCSACVEYGHDKATCKGCRATGHNRSACPNISYQSSQSQAQHPQPPLQPQAFLFSQQAQLTPEWGGMDLGMGLGQEQQWGGNFMY